MKRFMLFTVCCVLLGTAIVNANGASYRIRELSVGPQGSAGPPCLGIANAISPTHLVAGVVYDGGSSFGAVSDGTGGLRLLDAGFALGVNSSGHAVGYAGAAVMWDAAGLATTLPLPADTSFSLARAINDAGQAVGECWIGTHDVTNHIALWYPGAEPIILGEGCGNAINTGGQVAGFTRDTDGARRAFLWSPIGGLTTFVGGTASEATAINDRGWAAGTVSDAVGTWACVWTAPGAPTVLQNLPGSVSSMAYGINNAGAVVGSCDTPSGSFAVLWQPNGSVIGLGELADHSGSVAYAISSSGWIAGCSLDASGTPHPVVWELVPEPASIVALAVGLIGLAPLLRKRV